MKCAAQSYYANVPRRHLIWTTCVRCLATLKNRKKPKKIFEESTFQTDESVTSAPWTVVRRPILETLLKSYARHATVAQPLILHGPRGVGKRTVIEGLLGTWNKSPHTTAYVDLQANERDVQPWQMRERDGSLVHETGRASTRHTSEEKRFLYPSMAAIRVKLEQSLELLVRKAVEKGSVNSENVRDALLERSAVDEALRQFRMSHITMTVDCNTASSISTEQMWNTTVEGMKQAGSASFTGSLGAFQLSNVCTTSQQGYARDKILNQAAPCSSDSVEETLLTLALAKDLLKTQEIWRMSSGVSSRRQGVIPKASADAATSWVVLLLRLLSFAAAKGLFQSSRNWLSTT